MPTLRPSHSFAMAWTSACIGSSFSGSPTTCMRDTGAGMKSSSGMTERMARAACGMSRPGSSISLPVLVCRATSRPCDALAEVQPAHAAPPPSHLRAPAVHAIPMPHRLVRIDLEADELAARMLLALAQRCLADEVVGLGLEGHGEADPGLER